MSSNEQRATSNPALIAHHSALNIAWVLRRPFEEQVAFFRGKLGKLVPTRTWRDMLGRAHDRAFVVAGAAKADLLADLARAVDQAIAAGESLDKFRDRFGDIVRRRGWQGWTGSESHHGVLWRTRIIYQTNLATSYAAGRLAQLKRGGFAYWVYRHNDSVTHPRPLHVAWNGLTLPAGHPFWKTHYPPNGWGCRCYVLGARSEDMARALGGEPGKRPPPGWDGTDPRTGAPPGIDEGWNYMPGATAGLVRQIEKKAAALPPPLRANLEERTRQAREIAAVRRANEEILARAAKAPPGTEYAALIKDGERLWIKGGEAGARGVSFTMEEAADMRGAALTHNHPSSYSFSDKDLVLMANTGLRRIYAVGDNGALYAAAPRPGVSWRTIAHEYGEVGGFVTEEARKLYDAGKITETEYYRYHAHIVCLVLDARGRIRYHAALPWKTPDWAYRIVRMAL